MRPGDAECNHHINLGQTDRRMDEHANRQTKCNQFLTLFIGRDTQMRNIWTSEFYSKQLWAVFRAFMHRFGCKIY